MLTVLGTPMLHWLFRQTGRFHVYLARWVLALDPGETGWME